MSPLDELRALLRPAAGGLYLVSTGRAEQLELQRKLYLASNDAEVESKWHAALERIATSKVCVLGIPSDVGAGFRRGANLGPQMIRQTVLAEDPSWPSRANELGVIDVGDVFCVPQLLSDDMLNEAQIERARVALYPNLSTTFTADHRSKLPVSPLSIAERALELIFWLNPRVKPFVLGGDHSCAWPVVSSLVRREREPFAIVQMDAHTDLLAERLGVRMCFATWSYHANELLGRDGRLVQVGIRATRFDRGHWEGTLGVKQFWADACAQDPQGQIDAIANHLKKTGVRAIYFSNDIDGTDEAWADATGTPEAAGLTPDFVVALIARLKSDFEFLGADVMEVAPPLRDDPSKTLSLAARYFRESMSALLA